MNPRDAFAHALAARRVIARYLRAADYQEYVERKKQKGEKPLDKKDWEARTEGGGKDEPKKEEAEYEEYEVSEEEAYLDEAGKPITKLWRKKPKKDEPKEPEKKPEPKKEEKPEPKKDEPKEEPKRPVRHGTPREIEEEMMTEY